MAKQDFVKAIVMDFSQCPGPRYCEQGDDSGEEFYHKILNNLFYQAYKDGKKLLLDFDGPDGYASSFIDETYGNLLFDFGVDLVTKMVEVKSDEEPEWIDMINGRTLSKWSARINRKEVPKVTKKHSAWYRLINGKMEKKIWEDVK